MIPKAIVANMAASIPAGERKSVRCILLAPQRIESDAVLRAIHAAAKASGVRLVEFEEPPALGILEGVFSEIMRADLVIALVSNANPNVFYEAGLAHAAGKPVVFLLDEEGGPPFFARFTPTLIYTRSAEGLSNLKIGLRKVFDEFKQDPRRFRVFPKVPSRQAILPMVDLESLERIEPREFENLCFELLTQMGFRRVEWGKEIKEIDVVATLPKKDPDGFLYDELWLVSMGLHAPVEMLLDMMGGPPEFFLHHILRRSMKESPKALIRSDTPVTFLLILYRENKRSEMFFEELRRIERRSIERRSGYTLRIRTWDQQHLVGLIQQYPQIAYKYFSEEGRSQSRYRKSPEELYLENVELTKRLQAEQDKRVKAERDAVWKDVAFKAAHKLGNPVFALETDLQGLKRRLANHSGDALQVADEMGSSIEKAKEIIEQFKSLIRAQEIKVRPIDLVPIIEAASHVARENGVDVQVNAPKDHPRAMADPTRMTDCFDELFANALHWLNKQHKKIEVVLDIPDKRELPPGIDETKVYIRIRFEDNGCGVLPEQKDKIFAPFVTTYAHGTGLGLSLVQRVIEGHSGFIHEIGKPDQGALFELFIPQAISELETK